MSSKPNYKVDLSTEEDGKKSASDGEHVNSDPNDKMPGSNDASDVEEKTRVCTKVKTKVIKTKKGQLSVRHHRLHGKKIRQRKYKCKLCDNVSEQQKEHNKHMRTKHKDKKFQCFHCDREFISDSALYKHERSHFNLPYGCSHCPKRFQFPGQIEAHLKVHTKKEMYKCLHCPRLFTTNKIMLVHAKTHNESFKCTQPNCPTPDKEYNSKGNLAQHIRGEHGKGWLTPCGKTCKWKSLYHRHIKKCDDCIDLLEKAKKARYHFL